MGEGCIVKWYRIGNLGVEQGTEHLTVLILVLNTWHTWHIIHILLHLMFFDKLLTDQAILSSCIGTTFLCQRWKKQESYSVCVLWRYILHVFFCHISYHFKILSYISPEPSFFARGGKKTRIIFCVCSVKIYTLC